MSFLFDGANDNLTGSLTTAIPTVSMTVGVFAKYTTHPSATDIFVALAPLTGTNNNNIDIGTDTSANTYIAQSFNGTGTAANCNIAAINNDGLWVAYVFVITGSSLRDFYVGSIANTDQSTIARPSVDVKEIIVGESFVGTKDFTGRIAELAVWSTDLSASDITAYMGGTQASLIQPASLALYVPMATNSLLNLGTDSDGDLTKSGNAVFDSDHPTITGNSVQRASRAMLMDVG